MTISIIIPTLHEESHIAECIQSLRSQGPHHEIIVVDGGSTDGTWEAAADADLRLRSEPGRAIQMNHGAAHARGSILLFLHADCKLEAGALAAVQRAIARPHTAAGCFQMHISDPGFLYRPIGICASLRVRLTGLVYGDQGLFLRREMFHRIGGFPPLRLMEDVFLSRTLRRHGRIIVLPNKILVSPRRWQKSGIIRQTLRNWWLTAMAAVGVHPDQLARYYPVVR